MRNSSTRNMSIAEKSSKVIPTILNGILIYYSNNKSSKDKTSKYDLKPNRVGTITLNKKKNDMNGQNSEHKIIMIGDSFLRGCAENVKTYINDRYEGFGIVKPGGP